MAEQMIRVEVCHARPEACFLQTVTMEAGSTVRSAIEASGLLRAHPEIDLTTARVGVYGKLKSLDTALRDKDRVEVYRPLIADPKEARRRRVVKKGG